MSDLPPQQSGVSGDGRETILEKLAWVRKCKCERCPEGHNQSVTGCPTCDWAHGKYQLFTNKEVLRLLDAQYNKGLEAAESALPEKAESLEGKPLDALTTALQKDRAEKVFQPDGYNFAIDAARQSIRALRRGNAE